MFIAEFILSTSHNSILSNLDEATQLFNNNTNQLYTKFEGKNNII